MNSVVGNQGLEAFCVVVLIIGGISVSDNLNSLTSNVVEVVKNIVAPELSKRLSDEGLVDSWRSESHTNTMELGRFKYLTTLLKAKGDFATLSQVVETFMQQSKGKPNSGRAREHLKEIEYGT